MNQTKRSLFPILACILLLAGGAYAYIRFGRQNAGGDLLDPTALRVSGIVDTSNAIATAATAKTATGTQSRSIVPMLSIPAIRVHAPIEEVTVTARNTIATPKKLSDTAWYKLGPAPGQKGTAIIDGHVTNALGLPGVFSRLENIQIGDQVIVDWENGKEYVFRVTNISKYDYQDPNAPAALFASSGGSELKLVTCVGDWLPGERTYNKRLIVTAELVQ